MEIGQKRSVRKYKRWEVSKKKEKKIVLYLLKSVVEKLK